ncbi:hypothetical protein K439DRAFT_1659026 [Ramaria rubella]|nr:hypothetical protein K439DRAFT_1659026 [Ramaria rubella]
MCLKIYAFGRNLTETATRVRLPPPSPERRRRRKQSHGDYRVFGFVGLQYERFGVCACASGGGTSVPEIARGDDNGADRRDALFVRMDMHSDSSSVFSEASGLPSNPAAHRFLGSRRTRGSHAHTSVRAHRDRELKLIPTMNSNDAVQARRSKKTKMLLVEGVPSNVVIFNYSSQRKMRSRCSMDSHPPHFMPTSPQMGLYVEAAETADSQLAMRLFTGLKVRPQELCGVWFSFVSAGMHPLEHLQSREIFSSMKHLLEFTLTSSTSPTSYLLHPLPEVFPPDPEQSIAQALAVRLKDDDIRKSRAKMGAAVKQQQQRVPRASMSQPTHPHLQLSGRARVS